jgi:DNA-binding transcriptional ArsR family regulator
MSAGDKAGSVPLKEAAPLFAALGDGTRLELLDRLGKEGSLSITRLSTNSPVTRQAITKHLEILSEAGLVRSSRQGRERLWELEPARLADAHQFIERLSRQWDMALGRLKAYVEGDA